jgi:hypothetical protein
VLAKKCIVVPHKLNRRRARFLGIVGKRAEAIYSACNGSDKAAPSAERFRSPSRVRCLQDRL